MADPTLVNGQITDSVTQASVQVLGDAPTVPLAMTYQTVAQAISIGMQNTLIRQEEIQSNNLALLAQVSNLLLSNPSAVTAVATEKVLTGFTNNNSNAQLIDLLVNMFTGRECVYIDIYGNIIPDPKPDPDPDLKICT